ncbi:MAG TPA: hypothetical protein PLK55_00710 [archaeon]|nr:hypothetical protein [archaeon]
MIKSGVGGGKTITGLRFEERISLKQLFTQIKGYDIKNDDIFFNGKKIATFYQKHKIYKNFLEPSGINYLNYISKKLLPDDAIFVLKERTLFIIEIKFQEVAGSVDEKLQTCDFKNKQYNKLFKPLNIKVKYTYLLNDWFKKLEYKDVLDYIKSVNCYYFFNEIPLEFLGLPKP